MDRIFSVLLDCPAFLKKFTTSKELGKGIVDLMMPLGQCFTLTSSPKFASLLEIPVMAQFLSFYFIVKLINLWHIYNTIQVRGWVIITSSL